MFARHAPLSLMRGAFLRSLSPREARGPIYPFQEPLLNFRLNSGLALLPFPAGLGGLCQNEPWAMLVAYEKFTQTKSECVRGFPREAGKSARGQDTGATNQEKCRLRP